MQKQRKFAQKFKQSMESTGILKELLFALTLQYMEGEAMRAQK